MSERLRSVGLDVGTTTTQLILSELEIRNRASSFTVPEMEITDRRILYKSPVRFTPLLDEAHVDGEAIRELVTAEYERAGISRGDIDTGAIIITGETSRKENAQAVLNALSDFAGEFVVATAGPDLESVLAAKGAGAVAYSEKTGKTLLHFDIGGGTSNWALIEAGHITETGCLNIGGRLLKFDKNGVITYVSPVLADICDLRVGDRPPEEEISKLCKLLAQTLEMAAGLREPTELLHKLTTKECAANRFPRGEAVERSETEEERRALHNQEALKQDGMDDSLSIYRFDDTAQIARPVAVPLSTRLRRATFPPGEGFAPAAQTVSFSGGVADCIDTRHPWLEFGDMGPLLGRAIRESRLCRGEYTLGRETIRATVIGAGCHSAQLSGSTVFLRGMALPLKNLPVAVITREEQQSPDLPRIIARRLDALDADGVLALPGLPSPGYAEVVALAEGLLEGIRDRPVRIALEADMAKALGHALALRLPEGRPVLCIDRVKFTEGSYLDIGTPVGPALPVVVKTLVLNR